MDTANFRASAAFSRPLAVPDEELGELCKALGHPVRVRIVSILLEIGGCNSGELAEEFALAHSTVSEHLRILREAGLIEATASGSRRSYKVSSQRLAYLNALLTAFASKSF